MSTDQPSEPVTAPASPASTPGPTAGPGTDPGRATPPHQPQPGHHDHGAQFFDRIRDLGAYRSERDRYGAGVASGLARRWGVDPILIRIGFVVLTVIGGAGLLLYGLGWMFMPQEDGRIHAQQVMRGGVSAGFFGALVAILLGLGVDGGPGPWGYGGWGSPFGLVFTVLIIVGLVIWVSRNNTSGPGAPAAVEVPTAPGTSRPPAGPESPAAAFGPAAGPAAAFGPAAGPAPAFGTPSHEPAPPPSSQDHPTDPAHPYRPGTPYPSGPPSTRRNAAPSRALKRLTLGLAVLVGVVAYLIARVSQADDASVLIGMTAALAVLAGGVVVAGLTGRRAGAPAFLGVLLAFAVVAGTAGHGEGIGNRQSLTVAGDRLWAPTSTAQAEDGISQGVGQLTVRLTATGLTPATGTSTGPVEVPVRMGAGRMVIYLPDSAPARVEIEQGGGQVRDVSGAVRDGGGGQRLTYATGPAGEPRLTVRVRQGAGEIELFTAPVGSAPTANTGAPVPTPAVTATPTPSKGA